MHHPHPPPPPPLQGTSHASIVSEHYRTMLVTVTLFSVHTYMYIQQPWQWRCETRVFVSDAPVSTKTA